MRQIEGKRLLERFTIYHYKRTSRMFLLMIGEDCQNFLIKMFSNILGKRWAIALTCLVCVGCICKKWLNPPSFDDTPLDMLKNMKYYTWFKDYIGAIDERHTHAVILVENAIPYRFGRWVHTECHGCLFIRYTFYVDMAWTGRFHPWLEDIYGCNNEKEY